MKNRKIKPLSAILLAAIMLLAAACTRNDEIIDADDKNKPVGDPSAFSYAPELLSSNADYNGNLFYLNSLEFEVADPTVIYVAEGEQAGYFYAYGTSDSIGGHGFQSWRSRDLTHWESMGVAFKPDFSVHWAIRNHWAPEVIYDAEDGLYYMFYSAQPYWKTGNNFYMSVCYSENPQGPFISPDSRKDANGKTLSASQPVFNLTKGENAALPGDIARVAAIDVSPFVDPATGDKYLYFSYFDSFSKSEIFGMKMKDWFTPQYETLKQITAVGYLTIADSKAGIAQNTAEGTINEGPFVYYRDGVYYMTLSVYGYTDDKYQVRQALSDSPLGIYEKIPVADGGAVIVSGEIDNITSAGHHCFVNCGDELFIAYHTFYNRTDISNGRALAVDRVEFLENAAGDDIMHTNGPTYSLQPLPEQISGYKNIARSAAVTSDNTSEFSDVSLLNDGLVKYHGTDNLVSEYETGPGTTKITLQWGSFKTARAIMVYNSYDYDFTFVQIDSIELTYLSGKNGATSTLKIENLEFDWDWHVDAFDNMRPGSSAIAEFFDMPVSKITVALRSVDEDYGICIPEIVVLGKDAPVDRATFAEYSYENAQYNTPQLVYESLSFGQIGGLKSGYGYDLTHDDGTDGAYVVGNWCEDQSLFFNNVYGNRFYVEAEITVFENASYPYSTNQSDPYPKFGLAVSTPENTVFYYIDGNASYTSKAIGCAQRTLDNKDWDWNTTEQNFNAPGISYSKGNYVKLAILRDGAKFYFILDGVLAFTYDEFYVFDADKAAAVGFRSFSTGMKIRNYSATDDGAVINDKLAQYAG